MAGLNQCLADPLEGVMGGELQAGSQQSVCLGGFDHEPERVVVQAQEAGAAGIVARRFHETEHPGSKIYPGIHVRGANAQVTRG